MTEIRVVAAVADKNKVVFYQENGETITLKQTDPRLQKVLDVVIPLTLKNEVAIINLETFSVYKEYEEKSKGFVRFFKAAKSAVMSVFDPHEETSNKPRKELLAPQAPPLATVVKPFVDTKSVIPSTKSYETHKDNLKPLDKEETIADNETIVAVIGDVIIPNMENMKPYIAHALKNNSTIAVENFLKRIAPTIEKRGHSIQDLLRFMEKGDLPLAEDGCIIAYKVLKNDPKNKGGFVDCHTGKVTQKLGSYVCVNEDMVDRNRSNECSNGLHIARRGYIGSFYGDVCVLIKLAPEDVVTVPHNDANKVRAMGYHIINVLSDSSYQTLKSNMPMTKDSETSVMLADAINGNHIGRIEEVRIQGQRGGDLKIIQIIKGKYINTAGTDKAKAFDHDPVLEGKPVNPKDLNKTINKHYDNLNPPTKEGKETIHKAIAESVETSAERSARRKREKRAADKLAKTPKKISATGSIKGKKAELIILDDIGDNKPATSAQRKKIKKLVDDYASNPPKKPVSKPEPKKMEPVKAGSLSISDQALLLFKSNQFIELTKLKKAKKKSWSALGFTEAQIKEIAKYTTK